MQRHAALLLALIAGSALITHAAAQACTVANNATECEPPNICQASVTCKPTSLDSLDGTCVYANQLDGASCDDGDACTTDDTCQLGACTAGTAKDCSAGVDGECTTAGTCNPVSGSCVYTFADANTACNADNDACTLDTCSIPTDASTPATCTASAPKDCSAGVDNVCTLTGACDTSSGNCKYTYAAVGVECDTDDNVCTLDSCSGAPAGAAAPATCTAGAPKVCSAVDGVCTTSNVCNTTNGNCEYTYAAAGKPCDADDNVCTLDTCSGAPAGAAAPATCTANSAAIITFTPASDVNFPATAACAATVLPSALVTAKLNPLLTSGEVTLSADPPSPYSLGARDVVVTGSLPVTWADKSGECTASTTVTGVTVVDEEPIVPSQLSCGLPGGVTTTTTTIKPGGAAFTATYPAKSNGCPVTIAAALTSCKRCNGNSGKLGTCDPTVIADGAVFNITDAGGVDARITWQVTATDSLGTTAPKACGACVGNPGGKSTAPVCASPWTVGNDPVCNRVTGKPPAKPKPAPKPKAPTAPKAPKAPKAKKNRRMV